MKVYSDRKEKWVAKTTETENVGLQFDEPIHSEKRLGTNKRVDILGAKIDVLDMKQTVKLVEKYMETRTPLHLMGVNAHKVNEMRADKKMAEIVNSCGIINADGSSMILASRHFGTKLPERVSGIDLMQELMSLCEEKDYSVYFLGAKPEIVEKTRKIAEEQYPRLRIEGARDGYFGRPEWDNIAEELKKKKPSIVFVGITSPKKEYLIEFLQNRGVDAVLMGVGGSFDVISGVIPRAPKWMRRMNLEWLYRLIREPKRMYKRYLIGNVQFISDVRKEKKRRKSA